MIYRRFVLFVFILIAGLGGLPAVETMDGYIRLSIDENSCGFLLFYLADSFSEETSSEYEPLFSHRDPRTSFLAVNVDGRIYRLGESSVFHNRIEKQETNPAIVFESSFLQVNEVFSPVRTANSRVANGVKISITIKNTGNKPASVGLRMLIDTNLGEKRGNIPFVTDNLNITAEKVIEKGSGETFWISRGERLSLMGSIVNPPGVTGKAPDYLHFANWKKLSDAPWKAPYYDGQSFNYTQYSIGDSAVCYYWEPVTFAEGELSTYTIFLTTADNAGFAGAKPQQEVKPEPVKETNEDIIALQRLQGMLDKFITGEIYLDERDLAEIEQSVARLKTKYNLH